MHFCLSSRIVMTLFMLSIQNQESHPSGILKRDILCLIASFNRGSSFLVFVLVRLQTIFCSILILAASTIQILIRLRSQKSQRRLNLQASQRISPAHQATVMAYTFTSHCKRRLNRGNLRMPFHICWSIRVLNCHPVNLSFFQTDGLTLGMERSVCLTLTDYRFKLAHTC